MNSTLISLVAHSCEQNAKEETTLDGIVTKSFEAARNHWMATQDEDQFTGAVCAIYNLASEEDKSRVQAEMDSLRTLSAILSGVPVDMKRVQAVENPIGLRLRWTQVKNGNSVPNASKTTL